MAQGRAAFPAYLDQWRQYGLSTDSCLEIGCGVGRMTAQLLDVFEEVHAVDVSEEMLSKARVLVPGATYHLVRGSELPEVRTTAVFSTQVFQHFASEADAFDYFRSIGGVLRGSLLIQLPLYEWPSSLRLEPLYRARVAARNLLVDRIGGMRLRAYRQSWVGEVLESLGFADVQFRSFAVPGSAKGQSAVLARR